jgi:hypothetical protein
MQKKFFEALSAGKAEEASAILLKRLAREAPHSEWLGSTYLLQQDLTERLARAENEEDKQRIRDHYVAKILDIWEQFDKESPLPAKPDTSQNTDWLVKGIIGLVVLALLIILMEIITW